MSFFSLSPVEIDALRLSLKVAGMALAFSMVPGIVVAWTLSRTHFPGKHILNGVIHLPLVLPPVVIGYLLLVTLGKKGVIGSMLFRYLGITIAFTWKGAAVASAVMAFPLFVRAVKLSLDNVDQGLEACALTLGAGPVRVFFTITLPLMIPGIITGMILSFARSLGEFGATITFVSNIRGETQTLPLALYTLMQVPHGEAYAMRLCILSVAISMVALIVSQILEKRFSDHVKG